MNELLYEVNTGLIAAVLFISMVLAIEAGYRIGFARQHERGEAFRTHINGLQASILGILALLLGFTFSLALQRFDSRSEAVVDEANAIGTTWLRAQLLPLPVRAEVQALLREYVDTRVQAGSVTLADRAERQRLMAYATRTQDALWTGARKAAELEPNPVTTGLFIQSLNELIDRFGSRNAALDRHVPEVVLLLLYATFLMAGAIIGYASGVAGHRPSMVSHVMVVLIVVLVFLILDLDRPRRGLIEVSQRSLVDLQLSIRQDAGAAKPPVAPAAR